jgi:phage FluMu protein Com
MLAVVVALTFGVIAGLAARGRGRNGIGWFLAGVLVGPFALVVAVLPRVAREGLTIECPRCAEVIRVAAKACPHCGELLLGASEPLPAHPPRRRWED